MGDNRIERITRLLQKSWRKAQGRVKRNLITKQTAEKKAVKSDIRKGLEKLSRKANRKKSWGGRA